MQDVPSPTANSTRIHPDTMRNDWKRYLGCHILFFDTKAGGGDDSLIKERRMCEAGCHYRGAGRIPGPK